MTEVAIVILNFNGKHFLERFLPTLISSSPGCEIIVADNASTDGSVPFLRQKFHTVRVLEFDRNYGFCEGYNKALADIDAEYSVLLNSDIEVTPGWIAPVIRLFKSDPAIAAVQPKLLDYHFREKFEYAGGAGGFIDRFGYPFCRGRIFDTIETDTGQYNDTIEIFWATGACMFIRTQLFKEYGGFDADFFAHMEEIDLCWRLKLNGFKILHCGESWIYHVGGGTLPASNPKKTYLNFRNSLLVMIKNLPLAELFWKVVFRMIIDYVAMLKFMMDGKPKDAFMIFKAHIWVLRHFRSTIKKRPEKTSAMKSLSGTYSGFLLFYYHFSRKRLFSELKMPSRNTQDSNK